MPQLKWQIDAGNIITIAVLLVTMGVTYGTLRADVAYIDKYGTSAVRTLEAKIASLEAAIAVANVNMNNLREQITREREERLRGVSPSR